MEQSKYWDAQTGDKNLILERAIMASTNGIMIVRVDESELRTVYVNRAFETMTGYSSAEVLGASPGRLHQGDQDQAGLDELRQAIAQRRTTKVVLRNYRKDGSLFWNELAISPVQDQTGNVTHYIGILNDISDHKHAEQELMTWAMRLDALTTMSAEGLVSFDERGFLSYVNDAFLRLTGLAAYEVRGIDAETFDRLLARKSDPRHVCRSAVEDLAELKETGYIENRESEIQLLKPQKRTLMRLAKKGNHGTSVLLYFQDVTKARELEEIKSEFLATAAHELRTPMASILGYAELLLLRNFEPEQSRELLNIILRQSRRVTQLLNELLDLARIEARRGKDFNLIALDMRSIIQDVVAAFPDAQDRISVHVPDEQLQVNADKDKVYQALLNIMSNAIKFSAPEGIVNVSLPLKADKVPFVGVAIEDSGIGMTAAQLARLGERFFRADTSGKVPGTGLGVSLAKEIAAIHGGNLEATSESGKGSRFTLWLPLILPDEASPAKPAQVLVSDNRSANPFIADSNSIGEIPHGQNSAR